MSMELLDKSGLAYFWTKIKAYVAGLLSSKADDSDVVHKAGDEDITGTKTFVGSKKVAFKQSTANDKLGFTLFNNSNVEQGYLEYNPTNKISGVPLMTLGNYATAAAGLTYVGFRKYSNISGAAGAYNLLTPLISDARVPFNLTTTYTNFFLPLGVTDGTTTVVTDKSGLLDISSLLVSIDSSDAITAMTGYSKPSAGSAITVNDSLNDAIGKLEARLDGASDGFPSGTRMLFQQSAAPTGWTKETGSGYNNIALRLTTGNVANKTDGKAFAACMAAGRATASATQGGTIGDKTAGGSISETTAGGTVGNKALSVAMLASHDHIITYMSGGSTKPDYSFNQYNNNPHDNTGSKWTSKTGSGSNHNHGFTGTEHGHTFTGTAHNHTFTGSAHSHTIDLDINYIDCIVASKA